MNGFEGRGESEEQMPMEEPQEVSNNYNDNYNNSNAYGDQNGNANANAMANDNQPCLFERNSFQKCANTNNGSISACQWAFDLLRQCQEAPGNRNSANSYSY